MLAARTQLGTVHRRDNNVQASSAFSCVACAHTTAQPVVLLQHTLDKGVDLCAPLSCITTLVEVEQLLAEAAVRVRQLEGPQEVVGLLEVGAHGVDLVDQVLHADDARLAEVVLDDRVVRDGDALLVHLSEPALVDQLPHRLQVGVPVGHVRLDETEHLDRGGIQFHEHGVVDLAKAEKLQDLAHLG